MPAIKILRFPLTRPGWADYSEPESKVESNLHQEDYPVLALCVDCYVDWKERKCLKTSQLRELSEMTVNISSQ